MAKRHLLLFLALVMLSFNAFSQTSTEPQGSGTQQNPYLISTASEFLWITNDNDAYYKQTADIDLGDRGSINRAIISTFSGTYDGGGYTISYTAHFQGTTYDGNYALFGAVEGGVLKNINVNASVTITGTANNMQVALLCGKLLNNYNTYGTIINCNVTGNVNSTVSAEGGGGTDAGLLVGESQGQIKYCNGSGNVRGLGYVGGLVGQMSGGSVVGCSFVGSVTADSPREDWNDNRYGSFAGGICGFANSNTTINSCYVSANISLGVHNDGINNEESGIASTAINGSGTPTITNNYAEGTINGEAIGGCGITNSAGNTSYNYYPGGSTTNAGPGDCQTTSMTPEQITDALNAAIPDEDKPYVNFYVGGNNNDNVLFGTVCEEPTNLVISENEGIYTATWESSAISFSYTLSGGVFDSPLSGTTTEKSFSTNEPLVISANPYVFTVKAKCGEDNFTTEVSQSFIVECPKPTNLSVSGITYDGFTLNWTSSADCQVILGSNVVGEVTTNGNSKTYTFTGLNPETTYNVTIKAKCGEVYKEEASITVTTTRLSAPTNLAVSTEWNGSLQGNAKGTATITWDAIDGDGITYEVNTAGANNIIIQTNSYSKTGLAEGSYTVEVRAKKGDKYSDWVSMPYTVSSPLAPKNPQVTYTQNGTKFNVTVTWEQGGTGNSSYRWKVNGGSKQPSKTYTFRNQDPGDSFIISITETTKYSSSESEPLVVPIQVPCLPASEPTSVATTQTTVTFTFASEKQDRKIVIGSDVYIDASATSVTISDLNDATNYNYSVVEYCTETLYSEKTGTFTTKSCYAVSSLQAQATGVTTATASWLSQQSGEGLTYQVRLLQGENQISLTEQTATTINFTNLQSSTTYTVEVSEQCGSGYGDTRTINFTTENADFTTRQSGDFNTPSTWVNDRVPHGTTANITIGSEHVITVSHTLTITDSYKIVSNQGVLQITQLGELINTTNNNVGGIIEIETPIKTMNQWTFIGAPFKNNYQLGVIKPVSGSDISVSKYNYTAGRWSNSEDGANEWATVYTNIGVAEGLFAWPFYGGVVTFTTYGDVCTWDETANNGDGDWKIGSYDFKKPPVTALNNDNEITVTKSLTTSSGGKWMALSNPYPFKLKVATFLADNSLSTNNPKPNSNNVIQGEVIYKFNGTSWTTHNSGDINMTEGFFVNFTNGGENTATFKKTQRLTNQAKSSSAQREFVKLALVDGKKEIDLLFAHNEKSENSYDIYDANKMFSPIEIAEPYFVTGGFDLVKEEVKELPYYATMNVRSYKDTVMSFVMKSIPDGLSVSIIDGEDVINMYEGSVYTTEFLKGENEDRFKLYVRKADRLEEVRGRSVSITNCNRLVNVQSKEKDLTMDVFNAVGQIVYSTTEYNFNLASLPAGTYIVMAHNKRVNERVKIVIN